MDWFYAKNGQQNGPITTEQLTELYQSGQLPSGSLVWNDSMSDWAPVETVPEISAAPGAASSEDSTPAAPPTPDTPSQSASAAPSASAATSLSPTTAPYQGEKIPTYLWQSIVAILFCCLPAAIVSLVYAVKVDPALQAGDVATAKEASQKAKMWFWIAFGLGVVINIAIIGLSVASAAMTDMNNL